MRAFSVALVCAFSTVLVAQYPLVTSLEVRIGQRRPLSDPGPSQLVGQPGRAGRTHPSHRGGKAVPAQ